MDRILFLVPLATLLYLIADLDAVINSLRALLRSVSFWLLWLLFSILNGVAFSLFEAGAAKPLAANGIGQTWSTVIALFFSTLGTFSILQSFSLKFANYKAVDVEQMFEKLRTSVLSEAAAQKAELTKGRKLKLARQLVVYYTGHAGQIDQDYERLMAFGGRSAQEINQEIAAAAASPRGLIPTLVNTMVLADEAGARNALS